MTVELYGWQAHIDAGMGAPDLLDFIEQGRFGVAEIRDSLHGEAPLPARESWRLAKWLKASEEMRKRIDRNIEPEGRVPTPPAAEPAPEDPIEAAPAPAAESVEATLARLERKYGKL